MTDRRERPIGAEAAALERLRGHRVRADRGRGLGDELASFVKGVKKLSDQAQRAADAWAAAAPDAVAASTRVVDLKAGALRVVARSAADRHAADRWLRGGGLDELRAIAHAPISRVRFELDAGGWDAPKG
ncbi:MAG: hypothetical protein LAT64_04605 [Phycisphaerales bacterium]|nr:hypothetical protein [Planctomycetota bacterium]MCH8508034.1 hypothetical protein [Phycisphaerales bacterium]